MVVSDTADTVPAAVEFSAMLSDVPEVNANAPTSVTVTLYQRWGIGWKRLATWSARLGYGGLVVGTSRRQGSGTTPAGAYAITQTFGRLADPGTSMPYTKVTDDHWWVEDRSSRYYNEMRRGSQGGFALRTKGL